MNEELNKLYNGKMDKEQLESFIDKVDSMNDRELSAMLDSSEESDVFTQNDVDRMLHSSLNTIKKERRNAGYRYWSIRVAAVLIPLLIVGAILSIGNFRRLKEYEAVIARNITISTGIGEHSLTVLPDGTKVHMGPESELTYSLESFNDKFRRVSYNGEGTFEVSRDDNATFLMEAQDLEVRVLGTVFSVYDRKNKQESEVYLEKGSVELTATVSGEKQTLTPGTTALINNATGKMELYNDCDGFHRKAGQNRIFFSSAGLDEIAEEIELYYGYKIENGQNVSLSFTGSLPTDNLSEAIYILESTLDITLVIDSNRKTIVIEHIPS